MNVYKALSVHQPYASLIMSREKRVENRVWRTDHRGPLLLHASKTRESWDEETDSKRFPDAPFGQIIGVIEIVDCLSRRDILDGKHDERFPWLRDHYHMHGPWCWIIGRAFEVRPFAVRGMQGLFPVEAPQLDVDRLISAA